MKKALAAVPLVVTRQDILNFLRSL